MSGLVESEGIRVRTHQVLEAQRSNEHFDALYGIVQVLRAEHVTEQARLTAALSLLSDRLGLQRTMVSVVDQDAEEIVVACSDALSDEQRKRGRYRFGEGVVGHVISQQEPVLVPDIHADPRFLDRTRSRGSLENRAVSFLCAPIVSRGEVIGALAADRLDQSPAQLAADLQLLSIVASLMAESVRALGERQAQPASEPNRPEHPRAIIGSSQPIQELYRAISQVAPSETTVLVRGESGTGKELVAREIHTRSSRAQMPFVAVNCGSLPEHLMESELFGHARGAYTGAAGTRRGKFESADGGTIFLDEVGELSPAAQVKLLRVLQHRQFDRLGEDEPRTVSVRVIAATNANLEEAMEAGTFREDLFYRLNVFPLFVPPLRERTADITALADHFLARYTALHGKDVRRISTPAIELMMAYHWPGNVRELENCISRAVLLSCDGAIRQNDLPPTLQTGQSSNTSKRGSLKAMMDAFEREILVEAMKDAAGNQSKAARALSTTPRILSYRLKKHGLHEQLTTKS